MTRHHKPKPEPIPAPVPVPPPIVQPPPPVSPPSNAPRVTLEGFPAGYWGNILSPADILAVFQEIWLAHNELNNGVMPWRDFWLVYEPSVYGNTRPNEDARPGMNLGDAFCPAREGRIKWQVPAHEIRHCVLGASPFYYALVERYAFLQEALACAAAVWVLRKVINVTPARLSQAALWSVSAAMAEEANYQKSRYDYYIAHGCQFLVKMDIPNQTQDPRIIPTSQALDWFIIHVLDSDMAEEKHKKLSRCFAAEVGNRITFTGDRGVNQVAYIAAVLTACYGVDAKTYLRDTLKFKIDDALYAYFLEVLKGVV